MRIIILFVFCLFCISSCSSTPTNELSKPIDTSITIPIYTFQELDALGVLKLNFSATNNLMVQYQGDKLIILPTRSGEGRVTFTDKKTSDTLINIRVKTPSDTNFQKKLKDYDPINRLAGEDIRLYYANEYKLLNHELPYFSIRNINGDTLTDTDIPGQITLINFWYYGCPACMMEIEDLNRIKKHFEDERIVFYAFFKDSAYIEKGHNLYYVKLFENNKKIYKYLRSDYSFDQYINAESSGTTSSFGIKGYPQTFIIDTKGKVRYVFPGYGENVGETIRNCIVMLQNEQ
ncbi:MAG: TlpA family protein disulfide reductase [Chitinophagales bacterium]|nr:TlpA family protein disulfide reductase [Chitinophagales bacterium]